MADTSKIEAKPKEPTEAQKAAQSLPEELVSHEQEVQEELRQKHLADGRKSLEETRRSTQDEIGALKLDIPPEQISDLPTLDAMLGLKIEKVPKSVPAYLDMLVEKNPTLFEMPGASVIIVRHIQELLKAISVRPELANDRDWMNSLRQTLNHIIISPDLAQKITQLSRMDDSLRHALQSELGIENITEGLDANTRDIVQKVHTGFYRFDTKVNTWVNSLGAFVFLWPENIAGIKAYLRVKHPDHPFLSVTDYHSVDKSGKYAITSDGRPHNMFLAEADYLAEYIRLRSEGKNDNDVFAELGKKHVAHLGDNKAVQDSIDAFNQKYGESAFNAPTSFQLFAQNEKISTGALPAKIPEYTRIKDLIELEKYEYIIDEQRPEMKNIIYDIAAGFVRFDVQTHTFKTVTGQKLRFTEQELRLIDDVFSDVRPRSIFLTDTQILTYTTTDRDHSQYTDQILRDRLHYYQQ